MIEMGVDGYSRGKNPQFEISAAIHTFLANARRGYTIRLPLFNSIQEHLTSVIQRQDEKVILLTPAWPTQPWWTQILDMAVALPIWIPPHPANLVVADTERADTRRFLLRQDLLAWAISGVRQKGQSFRRTLQKRNLQQPEQILEKFMIFPGTGGSGLARKTTPKGQRILLGIYQLLSSPHF